jgi:hypothetical protein
MEQQRRQELLARKAVQASRKPKPAAEDAHEDGDGEVGGLVREVSVDDFLKSIAPVADAECRDSMQDTPEPMDVDEPDGAAQVSEAEGGGGRRGMKRPVAADFVDFEGTGGRTSSEPRRKTGSFASVSGMRRCVIDLSDSEDDGGFVEEDGVRGIEQNGWGTPPRGVTPGVGAEVLMEKEEEIRRMREIIAEKEERRLKKLSSRAGHGVWLGLNIYSETERAQGRIRSIRRVGTGRC